MNWFRFYHDALDDPKVQRLAPDLFKAWVNLLCLASKQDERGCLPSLEDIAFALRVDGDEAARYIGDLARAGLLDFDDEMCIHNWHGRQRVSDDVTERVRKHRSGPTNAVTLHETDTKRSRNGLDTEQSREDTEQSREDKSMRANAPKNTRGTIFPDDFEPPYEWAAKEIGMSIAAVDAEVPRMRDWALAKGEVKKDWTAFARNWLRRKHDEQPRGSPKAIPNGRPVEPKIAPKAAYQLLHEGERN
jgi:hypothetical protein